MGVRNYLVEGVSGTGKTSVCAELRRRGHHAVNGDTDLAYRDDPATGEPTDERGDGASAHWQHLWSVDAVQALVADRSAAVTFLCGGSRNTEAFLDLLDGVFVLEVDAETLVRRLDARPDEFGAAPDERELVLRLHRTGEDTPPGVGIDATAPLSEVVEVILHHVATDIDGSAP